MPSVDKYRRNIRSICLLAGFLSLLGVGGFGGGLVVFYYWHPDNTVSTWKYCQTMLIYSTGYSLLFFWLYTQTRGLLRLITMGGCHGESGH